jgi:hypothetical protein
VTREGTRERAVERGVEKSETSIAMVSRQSRMREDEEDARESGEAMAV